MDNKEIKVSVVMTAYDVEDYIHDAMTSVLNSTYKNIELIVVEDVSTDDTPNIIKSIADDRVKVITNKVNVGAGLARRIGIEACTGDYIITVDGDDSITEDFIESLVNRATETGADIALGGITLVGSKGSTTLKKYENTVSEGEDIFKDYSRGLIVFLNNMLVRRTLYATTEERLNNTPNKVVYSSRRYVEDTPTMIPLMYYANKIAYCTNTGYNYLMRNDSLTHEADDFKTNLYQALCICSIFKFLNGKEDIYQQYIPAKRFIELTKNIRKNATTELIKQYYDDYIEFTLDLMDLVNEPARK